MIYVLTKNSSTQLDLWSSAKEQIRSSISSSLRSVAKTVNSFIENRGGFACLIGLLIVPSQFLCPKAEEANQIVNQAAQNPDCKIQRFSLPVENSSAQVEGIIYYPQGWNPLDRSRCVVYHNPNGVAVSQYLENGKLSWTPAQILKLAKCPILLYDYRGTGLSSKNKFFAPFGFWPTYETIAVDGETVLKYALKQFQSAAIMGSSLGGGVATVSLDRHLKSYPDDSKKVNLINHDSFSSTPRVIMPGLPRFANWAGWALGGLVDAETSMKRLIERGIPITVLCHRDDPVIPAGARMAEAVEKLSRKQNVSIIDSPEYGHANLSHDMVLQLKRI